MAMEDVTMEDEERTPSLRIGGDEQESPNAGEEMEPVSQDPDENPAPPADTPPSEGNDDGDEPPEPTTPAETPAAEPEEEYAAQADSSKKKSNNKKRKADGEPAKKPKKRTNVWKSTTRKGGKKNARVAQAGKALEPDNSIYLTPIVPKVEDGPDLPVVLSKVQKSEKVELSSDQLSASSCKGYRMVRATRGVVEGAWYFEIKVEHLGKTGHTRLGWSTQKGEIQAPVGYDSYSYGYRDMEGSKVHAALREPYGEAYGEGDVLGFYINLPNGAALAPKPPEIVSFKGAPYTPEVKEEPLKPVPDSEVTFFKNGVCQGTAYKDIYAGRYFPAASMYTLPNEPPCTVRFNFGPDFDFLPANFDGRPQPQPLSSAPFADAQVIESSTVSTVTAARTQTEQMDVDMQNQTETKKSAKGSASKPPKPSTKKSINGKKNGKEQTAPVEIRVESTGSIASQAEEVRQDATSLLL